MEGTGIEFTRAKYVGWQFSSGAIFCLFVGVLQRFPHKWSPKSLKDGKINYCVGCFAKSITLEIALMHKICDQLQVFRKKKNAAAFLRPCSVSWSRPALPLAADLWAQCNQVWSFFWTSLLLTLAPPTDVNVHSQLLQPVRSTHKMRVYSCRRSARAMHGLTHSSWHPSRGAYTWHGSTTCAHLPKYHNNSKNGLSWGPLEIPPRHFYSSALCVVPKLGTTLP